MAMLNIHRVISFVTNDDRDILSPRHGCNTTIDNFGKVLAHVVLPDTENLARGIANYSAID